MEKIPPTLGLPVTTRTMSWEMMVIKEWGSEYRKPDIAYIFSDGVTKDSTDQWNTGIYQKP